LTLRVRVTPEARSDLADARDWYETASAGLGDDFLDEVEATLRSAADWPNAAPVAERTMRRALVARFPYGVFYGLLRRGWATILSSSAAYTSDATRVCGKADG
jgi:plasmid stabilization system protein ParE